MDAEDSAGSKRGRAGRAIQLRGWLTFVAANMDRAALSVLFDFLLLGCILKCAAGLVKRRLPALRVVPRRSDTRSEGLLGHTQAFRTMR